MSGSASIDAEFVTFSFTKSEAKLKRTSRRRFPSDDQDDRAHAEKPLKGDPLRIRAEDVAYANDAANDPRTFVFGLEKSGAEFVRHRRAAIEIARIRPVANLLRFACVVCV